MRKQEAFSLKTNLGILTMGIIRIFFWWCLAELMIHFMYIHAICSTSSPLEAMSYWALGEYIKKKNEEISCLFPLSRIPAYFMSISSYE